MADGVPPHSINLQDHPGQSMNDHFDSHNPCEPSMKGIADIEGNAEQACYSVVAARDKNQGDEIDSCKSTGSIAEMFHP